MSWLSFIIQSSCWVTVGQLGFSLSIWVWWREAATRWLCGSCKRGSSIIASHYVTDIISNSCSSVSLHQSNCTVERNLLLSSVLDLNGIYGFFSPSISSSFSADSFSSPNCETNCPKTHQSDSKMTLSDARSHEFIPSEFSQRTQSSNLLSLNPSSADGSVHPHVQERSLPPEEEEETQTDSWSGVISQVVWRTIRSFLKRLDGLKTNLPVLEEKAPPPPPPPWGPGGGVVYLLHKQCVILCTGCENLLWF